MIDAGGKANLFQQSAGTLVEGAGGVLGMSGHRRDEDILQDGTLGQQMVELEDEADR